MAIINVTFDTVEKTMSVTKDGTVMPNCEYVHVGRSWKNERDFFCEINQAQKDDAADMTTWIRTCANEKGLLNIVEKKTIPNGDIEKDVAEFFKVK